MRRQLLERTVIGATIASIALVTSACGGNLGEDTSAEFPAGPVTVTVGQAAGGSTDLIARAVANGLSDDLGVAVPVINMPGANGAVATKAVAEMRPNGQNLVLLNASLITITPLAVGEQDAVSLGDLDVIKGLSQDDYVLVASEESGLDSMDDLLAAPGNLSLGTTGVGTGSQLAQALLFAQAGIDGNLVPFDSGSPALTAAIGNQVQLTTVQVGEAKPQIDAGTVQPIVVFSNERNPYLSDVPTAAELGYDVPVAQYRALAAPPGLPDETKSRLVAAVDAVLASDAYREFNTANLLTPREISGEEVVTEWNDLAARYRQLTEDNGVSLTG